MFFLSKNKKGFLLSEALIIAGLTLVVGLAVWGLGRDVFFIGGVLEDSLSAEVDSKEALSNMSAFIRTSSLGEDGSYPILYANDNELVFFADINKDGKSEMVRYFLDGSDLKMGVILAVNNPPQYPEESEIVSVVAKNIKNEGEALFSYYDSSFSGTEDKLSLPIDVLKIRLISIKMILDKNVIRAPEALVLETKISIRNLKDNL